MIDSTQHPKVGVGVIVIKDNKILLGKRKNSHGEGTWSLGGGHLEFGETLESCAVREVLEETGMVVKNVRPLTFTNDIFLSESKHYVTLFVVADHELGDPNVLEPDKCELWGWFEAESLPQPLFLPVQNLLTNQPNLFTRLVQ